MELKDETALSVGMMSLAMGILVGRFTHFEVSGFSISDFVEGILTGVSLVMNLYYLVRKSRKQRAIVFSSFGWLLAFYALQFNSNISDSYISQLFD